MAGQLAARGSRAVADLGRHRAGQPGYFRERQYGKVPPLPGQLDLPVPLGRPVPAHTARLPVSSRAAVLPRLAGDGAEFGGQPVPVGAQPGTIGFGCGDQGRGVLTGLRGVGAQAVCLPLVPGAQFLPFPAGIGQRRGLS
jgi:hypothetical protein